MILVLVSVMFVLAGCAGSTPNNKPANLESQKLEQHFLWKISDENSSVWVLGSVHFGDESFYPLDSVIESAFEGAEELAVEIDMSDDSVKTEVAEQTMRKGLNKPGVRLQDILPAEVWKSFDSICVDWGIPSESFQMLRPWFAATSLSAYAIQRSGIDPALGVDVVLMERASAEGKAIVGLETAQEQVGALADSGVPADSSAADSSAEGSSAAASGVADTVADTDADTGVADSDSAGIYYLKTTLREISELDSIVSQVVVAWKTGNDSLLQVALGDEDSDDESYDADESAAEKSFKEDLEKRVYTSRNEKMAESIGNFLKENRNVFVVVGAAHLALEKGNVIELLKKKGFKVERF